MPWSTRHSSSRDSPVSLLKTTAGKRRPVHVEVPHVSPGKSRDNSRDSRGRRHSPPSRKIIPTLTQHLGERRNSKPNWNLQRQRCLSRCYMSLAARSQKSCTILGGKRRLLLRSILTNGWNQLSRVSPKQIGRASCRERV